MGNQEVMDMGEFGVSELLFGAGKEPGTRPGLGV